MTVTPPSGWLWGQYSALGAMIAVPTAVIDQAHKWWMILGLKMTEGTRIPVAPFLDFIYLKNTGISYSLFKLPGMQGQLLLAAFALAASIGLWVYIARGAESRLMAASLALILGGAIGNGIDRVTLGGVADFFQLHWGSYSWYIFNIADVAIVAGVAGLLYDSIIESRKRATKAR